MADNKDKNDSDSDETSAEGAGLDPNAEGAEGAPKRSKKKIIIIAGAVILLLSSIGGAVFFSGVLKKKPQPAEHSAQGEADGHTAEGDAAPTEEASAGGHGGGESDGHGGGHGGGSAPKVTYVDLKDILVNLNSTGSKSNFLKLKVSLELTNAGGESVVKDYEPRIFDTFQVYLRGLRVEDLKGQQGIQSLRQELLTRLQSTVPDAKIKDILFREVLVQ